MGVRYQKIILGLSLIISMVLTGLEVDKSKHLD